MPFTQEYIENFLKNPPKEELLFSQEYLDILLRDYTKKEIDLIKMDLETLAKYCDFIYSNGTDIPEEKEEKLEYWATAGGPGAGKSTVLEAWLEKNPPKFYVDPDQVCLKRMYAYIGHLSMVRYATATSYHATQQAAYEKWRAASNYIACTLLNMAYAKNNEKKKRYSIAHGTTSTNPKIEFLYKKLQEKNYSINLLLCYAEDDLRENAIHMRETGQSFVQVDPAEVVSKGDSFPKMFDTYFKYVSETGGEIQFYWQEKMQHGILPMPCAKYTKSDGIVVLYETGWQHFCDKYMRDVKRLDIPVCSIMEPFLSMKLANNMDFVAPGRFGLLKPGPMDPEKNEAKKIKRVRSHFST